MPVMNLSVSSFPFTHAGQAIGINLMVLVTDGNGKPFTGLKQKDFRVRWIQNVKMDLGLKPLAFAEYTAANNLPDIPGAYMLELISESGSWREPATFHIAVHKRRYYYNARGQTLYRVDDHALSSQP